MRIFLLTACLFAATTLLAQGKRYRLKGYTDSTMVYFSRTATCRMDCLHLSEDDVREVLKTGEATPGKPRDSSSTSTIFLFEGDIRGNRRMRMVATPKGTSLFVITVSLYGEKMSCDCGKKSG